MALCRGTVASGFPSPDTQNEVLEVVSEFNRNLLGSLSVKVVKTPRTICATAAQGILHINRLDLDA
jgi:hypothetical protein